MGSVRNNLGGGASRKRLTEELYTALQYSGLVTPDMSLEDMIAVLANEYPQFDGIFYINGDERTAATGGYTGTSYANANGSASWGEYQGAKLYVSTSSLNSTTIEGYVQTQYAIWIPKKYKYLNLAWEGFSDAPEYTTYFVYGRGGVRLVTPGGAVVSGATLFDLRAYNADIQTASGTAKIDISSVTEQALYLRLWNHAVGTVYLGEAKANASGLYVSHAWLTAE